ncbi:aldo/keto reductase [Wukongibacter baidiensis]|uniref:aldo/keto reductase n=1 Tax=Wukongibacter baidiensis TaxID=1723361 RepID=UPI003D7FD66B
MIYRKFGNTNIKLPILGMGTMRLPSKNIKGIESINESESINLIEVAVSKGINYFDTAWPYHGGMSEVILGKVIKNQKRTDLYIATKSPTWEISSTEDFNRILNQQLEKLETDYIDFYMFHALGNRRWQNILSNNLLQAMQDAKKDGRVKHIGFSFHDNLDMFKRIIDDFDQWDFCQIQYNYRDIDKQAGTKGLEYAYEKGLGIIVMEPLRGGELVHLPKRVADFLPQNKNSVEWGLDFLWDKPEINLVLSGMSSIAEIEKNVEYANRSSVGMLSNYHKQLLLQAKQIFDDSPMIYCTKCNYCISCPSKIKIPKIIEAYNMIFSKDYTKAKQHYDILTISQSSCQLCDKCNEICPQNINISNLLPIIEEAFSKSIPDINWDALKMKWPERYELKKRMQQRK